MPSALTPRLQRMAPYFIIGWLLGVLIVTRPSLEEHTPTRKIQIRAAEFYEPPLHPGTVALGQVLFSVLGLAVFTRRRTRSPVTIRSN